MFAPQHLPAQRSRSPILLTGAVLLGMLGAVTRWSQNGTATGDADTAFVTAAVPRSSAPGQQSLRAASAIIRLGGRDWNADGTRKNSGGGVPDAAALAAAQAAKANAKKSTGGDGKVDRTPPHIYKGAPVIFNGKEVARVNGTLAEYKVDIWSGAHPVWQGKKAKVLLDAGSVTKFQERFQGMSDLFGTAGLEQLKKNEQIKKEQEERKKAGLKAL